MPVDDAADVARARGGDEEAFRVLVDRHSRRIYHLAYRMTGRVEDAEDVVQEALVRAYRQLNRFEARSHFGTWLYRITFNCAVDYLRARPRREVTDGQDDLDRRPSPQTSFGADDLVFAGEIAARIEQALNTLSPQERAAFVMRHYQGCSIGEICRTLNVRTNAAKHSIFRAVRKLRTALRPLAETRTE